MKYTNKIIIEIIIVLTHLDIKCLNVLKLLNLVILNKGDQKMRYSTLMNLIDLDDTIESSEIDTHIVSEIELWLDNTYHLYQIKMQFVDNFIKNNIDEENENPIDEEKINEEFDYTCSQVATLLKSTIQEYYKIIGNELFENITYATIKQLKIEFALNIKNEIFEKENYEDFTIRRLEK